MFDCKIWTYYQIINCSAKRDLFGYGSLEPISTDVATMSLLQIRTSRRILLFLLIGLSIKYLLKHYRVKSQTLLATCGAFNAKAKSFWQHLTFLTVLALLARPTLLFPQGAFEPRCSQTSWCTCASRRRVQPRWLSCLIGRPGSTGSDLNTLSCGKTRPGSISRNSNRYSTRPTFSQF